jgi:hypothetical protein
MSTTEHGRKAAQHVLWPSTPPVALVWHLLSARATP